MEEEIVFLDPATCEPDENGVQFSRIVTESGVVILIPVTPPLPPPTLDEFKAAKITELVTARDEAMAQPFQSSALGELHRYPAGDVAQKDIQAVMRYLEIAERQGQTQPTYPYLTLDAGPLMHNRDQIELVYLDGFAAVNAQVLRYRELYAQVDAASSPEEVNAIQWEAPTNP